MNALHTMGAVLRAVLRRPSVDFNSEVLLRLCGLQEPDAVLARLIDALSAVLLGTRTPASKAAAVSCLLLLLCGAPNMHENVLLDYCKLSATPLLAAVVEVCVSVCLRGSMCM
jgi:hypothetical protein